MDRTGMNSSDVTKKDFFIRQLKSQLKNMAIDKKYLESELKRVKKCASCLCSEKYQESNVDLSNLLDVRRSGSLAKSSSFLAMSLAPPNDPQPTGSTAIHFQELRSLRETNYCLEKSVFNLQQMFREKSNEISALEERNEKIVEDLKQQIYNLLSERNEDERIGLSKGGRDDVTASRLDALTKERSHLLRRIRHLEDQLESARNIQYNERDRKPLKDFDDVEYSHINPYCRTCYRSFSDWTKLSRNFKQAKMEAQLSSNAVRENVIGKEATDIPANEVMEGSRKSTGQKYSKSVSTRDMDEFEQSKIQPNTVREYQCVVSQLERDLLEANKKIIDLELKMAASRGKEVDPDGVDKLTQRKINKLEADKRCFQKRLEEQDSVLVQLEQDIASLMDENNVFKRRCDDLETANKSAIGQNLVLSEAIKTLRSELSKADDTQDESARNYASQIEELQGLLKEKESERAELIQRLTSDDQVHTCATTNIEMLFDYLLPDEKEEVRVRYIDETAINDETYIKEINVIESPDEDERVSGRILSMETPHIVEKTYISSNVELLYAKRKISELEVEVENLKKELSTVKNYLEIEKSSSRMSETRNNDFEELLEITNGEISKLNLELRNSKDNSNFLKERIYDLETRCNLKDRQIRELTTAKSFLTSRINELADPTIISTINQLRSRLRASASSRGSPSNENAITEAKTSSAPQ